MVLRKITTKNSQGVKCLVRKEGNVMSVGKRIYLKREMPDMEVMNQFKSIPASNTADVMGRSCAMNPRIAWSAVQRRR